MASVLPFLLPNSRIVAGIGSYQAVGGAFWNRTRSVASGYNLTVRYGAKRTSKTVYTSSILVVASSNIINDLV
jgi:hypothetical protein